MPPTARAKKIVRLVAAGLAVGVAIAGLIAYAFRENIEGYRRYAALCAAQAGMHLYWPIERGAVWSVRQQFQASLPLLNPGKVAFVRFAGSDGRVYDAHGVASATPSLPESRLEIAELGIPVDYRYRVRHEDDVPGLLRVSAIHQEVTDMRSGDLMLRYSDFQYTWFEPGFWWLPEPLVDHCPNEAWTPDPARPGRRLPTMAETAFRNIFAEERAPR